MKTNIEIIMHTVAKQAITKYVGLNQYVVFEPKKKIIKKRRNNFVINF